MQINKFTSKRRMSITRVLKPLGKESTHTVVEDIDEPSETKMTSAILKPKETLISQTDSKKSVGSTKEQTPNNLDVLESSDKELKDEKLPETSAYAD